MWRYLETVCFEICKPRIVCSFFLIALAVMNPFDSSVKYSINKIAVSVIFFSFLKSYWYSIFRLQEFYIYFNIKLRLIDKMVLFKIKNNLIIYSFNMPYIGTTLFNRQVITIKKLYPVTNFFSGFQFLFSQKSF